MTAERWQRVYALYTRALDVSLDTRESWLRNQSGDDPEAVREVMRLLALESLADSFMEVSAASLLDLGKNQPPVFEPGDEIAGRYRIEKLIGKGGMGEVFAAFDTEIGVNIALKTVHISRLDDPSAQRQLRREAQLARDITHPNVCRIHDISRHRLDGRRGEVMVLAMELLDGPTLRDYLAASKPIAETQALEIASQICRGLAAAHEKRIVHRDLKAANVILCQEKTGLRAVITDFGLSRRQGTLGPETEKSITHLLGTPDYMAPELFSGKRGDVASDIYALGVLLFELAAGEKPYGPAESLEHLLRRLEQPAPGPRTRNPLTSEIWDETTRACLDRDPNRRPASALEVEAMLRGTIRVAPRFPRRGMLLALAGLGTGLTGASLWLRGPSALVVYPIENRSGDAGLNYRGAGMWTELIRQLMSLPGFRVMAYPDQRPKAPHSLPARLALGASIQPDRSIVLDLTKPASGTVVWTERIAGEDNLPALQRKVYDACVRGLKRASPLGSSFASMFASGGQSQAAVTTNAQALGYYFHGTFLLRSRTIGDTLEGIQYLQNALRLDPHFALAYAAIAEAQVGLIENSYRPTAELLLAGHGYAERAVREGPQFAETHLILASFRQMVWDWDGARASFQEVFRKQPESARGHAWYAGMLLQFAATDQVLAEYRRAMAADPFDQIIRNGYGIGLFFCGHYDEAIRVQEEAVRTRNSLVGRQHIGNVHAWQGYRSTGPERSEHFRVAFEQAAAVEEAERKAPRGAEAGMRNSDRMYSLFHALAGNSGAAASYIAKLEAGIHDGRVSPAMIARAYAALGEKDKAMDLIELALARKDRVLMYIRTNPFFQVLQPHPRYQAVLRVMQL
ncbi:MAG: protein kinase [Acidobacteria bacterium]|nr:protein kinase [Acidobacteriota bacterium]